MLEKFKAGLEARVRYCSNMEMKVESLAFITQDRESKGQPGINVLGKVLW